MEMEIIDPYTHPGVFVQSMKKQVGRVDLFGSQQASCSYDHAMLLLAAYDDDNVDSLVIIILYNYTSILAV